MQIDMHYYATYSMARAAGMDKHSANIVATSAQFVDDNTAKSHVNLQDGSRIDQEPTAHHALNLKNLKEHHQRQIWVPFHFIPGGTGETYTERFKCRMDSNIVRELCNHHLQYSDRKFALHLLGITAHVYADTFSHFGFSGVSSRGNKVDNLSFKFHEELDDKNEIDDEIHPLSTSMRDYVTNKKDKFFEDLGDHGGLFDNIRANIKGAFAENVSGALGHGSVATLPDRPYLIWSFNYERPDTIEKTTSIRNNPQNYLKACQSLHKMLKQFTDIRTENLDAQNVVEGRDFQDIEASVKKILLVQADKTGRINAWQKAVKNGELFDADDDEIPEYDGEKWNKQWDKLDGAENYQSAEELPIWQFYRAAALHRTYVLRDLLPKHRLIVN